MTGFGTGAVKALLLPVHIVVALAITLLAGVVIQDFWSWFVAPVFDFLDPLTLKESVGLMFGVTVFFVLQNAGIAMQLPEKEVPVTLATRNFVYTVVLLVVWGIGALWYHLFVGA